MAKRPDSLPKPKAMRPAILPLRPILGSSPTHSTTSSPSMSRRSSSSGSTGSITGKCVHFPCNPAKLAISHLTHSREVYDRSPIIPSGEDLDIPSCKSEEGSWIKCLQRQAKEAARAGQAPPHTSALLRSSTEYDSSDFEPALTSPCSDISLPSLGHDDYSSCSETDDLGPLSNSSSNAFHFTTSSTAHCRSPSLDMYLSLSVKEELVQQRQEWQGDVDMVSDDCEEEEDETQTPAEASEQAPRKLGMCALGKFSRKSLFENDAFGGF